MLFIVYLHKAQPYIDIDISAFMEDVHRFRFVT